MHHKKYLKYKKKYIEYEKKQQGGEKIYIDIEKIKNTVRKDLDDKNISIIKDYIKENLFDKKTDLKGSVFPVFYLFDEYINNNIGSYQTVRDKILNYLEINNNIGIISQNIINISTGSHATIFYKFTYLESEYLYYSNSGFGINKNHFMKDDNYVFPKIFKIYNKYNIINQIKKINKILLEIDRYDLETYEIKKNIIDIIAEFSVELLPIDLMDIKKKKELIDINKEYIKKIIKFGNVSNNEKKQSLLYTFLNYLVINNDENIKQCSFNNIINNNEKDMCKYYIYENINLYELFINTLSNNNSVLFKKKYQELTDNKNDCFKIYVNQINKYLNNIPKKFSTLKFMLKRLLINYDDKLGICNLMQNSGSCTFYSYYLMATNIALINSFIKSNNAKEYLEKIIKVHYKIIYFFGISNNYRIIDIKINEYFNNNYILNLCNEHNLSKEIIEFYNKESFILKKNNNFLNQNVLLSSIAYDDSLCQNFDVEFITILNNGLKNIINEIRDKIDITNSYLKKNFDCLFKNIIKNYVNKNRHITIKIFTYADFNYKLQAILYNVKDLYYIYSLILKHIYYGEKNRNELEFLPIDYSYISSRDKDYNNFNINNLKMIDLSFDTQSNKKSVRHYMPKFLNDNNFFLNLLNFKERINFSNFLKMLIKKNRCQTDDFLNILKKELDITEINSSIYIFDDNFYNDINLKKIYNLDIKESALPNYINRYPSITNENRFYGQFKGFCNYLYNVNNNNSLNSSNNYIVNLFRKNLSKMKDEYIPINIATQTKFNFFSDEYIENTYEFFNQLVTISNNPGKYYLIKNGRDLNSKIKKLVDNYKIDDARWTNGEIYNSITGQILLNHTNYEWISKINITTSDFTHFIYDNRNYLIYKLVKFDNLKFILAKLGFSEYDTPNFIIIKNTSTILIITADNFICNPSRCFILNVINGAIKEITMINEKNKKYNLILNPDYNLIPFIKFIPSKCIFLCYKENNYYVFEIIINIGFITNIDNALYEQIYYPKFDYTKFPKSFVIKYIIAPSATLPLSHTFNKEEYENLLSFYYSDYIIKNYVNYKNKLKETYNSKLIYDVLNKPINNIISSIKKIITINEDNFNTCNTKIIKYDLNIKCNLKNLLKDYRFCNIKKEEIANQKHVLNDIKKLLEKNLECIKLNDNINFKLFLIDNLDKLLLKMTCNILINLIDQISNEDVICNEIQPILISLESTNLFINELKDNKYNIYELIFLLQSEYFLKYDQLKKYREIKNDIGNDKLKLHQFMMGKGKTSVFTPLLSFTIKLIHNKQPTIITASHLVSSTIKIVSLNSYLYDINVEVYSDFQAKKRWITNYMITDGVLKSDPINFNNEYNIIDEFDSHHNYLQSIFNYVKTNKKCLDDKYEFINIYDFVYDKINDKKVKENYLNKFLEFYYNQSTKMIYNINYGFDPTNIYTVCIPFSRKDTPIKGSNFSSLLLILILTFKIYIENYNSKLQDSDYLKISKDKKLLNDFYKIHDNLDNFLSDIVIEKEEFTYDNIKNKFEDIYKQMDENIKKNILLIYLYEINYEILKYASEQYNLSFQDIIYNNNKQWQVGYTGTVNIKLNDYNNETYVFKEIIPDYDEKIEILLALNMTKNKLPNKVFNINKSISDINTLINNVICFLSEMNYKGIERGFIDLDGLFKDYDNKLIAIKFLEKYNNKKIIYFNDNEPYQLYNNEDIIVNEKYDNTIDNKNFYYYDNAHTVGSDLKQPQIGNIVIIIGENTRYTDFAQGIFRFRKLNSGTYLSVMIRSNIKYEIDNIYKLLNDNDKNFNKHQEDGLKFQLLKTMIRKKTKNYLELELKPDFLYEKIDENIVKKIFANFLIGYKTTDDSTDNTADPNIIKLINYFERNNLLLQKLIFGYNESDFKNTNTTIDNFIEIQAEIQDEIEAEIHDEMEASAEAETIGQHNQYLTGIKLDLLKKNVFIYHKNCNYCRETTCTKLFKTDIKINNKDIYISYNLLKNFMDFISIPLEYMIEVVISKLQLLNFVEFKDYILIELEYICDSHYFNLLPIYDLYGNIKNNLRYQPDIGNGNIFSDKLLLPTLLVKIFGIDYVYNEESLSKELLIPFQIDEIDNFTYDGFIILSIYFKNYFRFLTNLQIKKSKIFNLSKTFLKLIFFNVEDYVFIIKSQIKKNKGTLKSCRNKDTFNNNKLNRYNDDKIYYIDDLKEMPNDFIYITDTTEIESLIYDQDPKNIVKKHDFRKNNRK